MDRDMKAGKGGQEWGWGRGSDTNMEGEERGEEWCRNRSSKEEGSKSRIKTEQRQNTTGSAARNGMLLSKIHIAVLNMKMSLPVGVNLDSKLQGR